MTTGCGSNARTSEAQEPEDGEEEASSEDGHNDTAPELSLSGYDQPEQQSAHHYPR